jgi:hypothetical protein
MIVANQKMAKSLLVSFFLILSTSIFGGVVEDGLRQISLHDRVCMKAFFDDAIKMDQIAHVLYFKNKPVSVIGKALKAKGRYFNDILCLKGWRAFKKNEHFFPHPHFIFSENVVCFNENFTALHIYLINKESLELCLQQYIHLFQKALGQEFNPRQFITQLEEGYSLDSLINKDEMLLGILLGFGEEASKTFRDFEEEYGDHPDESNAETYCGIELKRPKGCKINPVTFMGNPHSPQVKILAATYEDELEEISKIYRDKKDPLKMVLEKLCEK